MSEQMERRLNLVADEHRYTPENTVAVLRARPMFRSRRQVEHIEENDAVDAVDGFVVVKKSISAPIPMNSAVAGDAPLPPSMQDGEFHLVYAVEAMREHAQRYLQKKMN